MRNPLRWVWRRKGRLGAVALLVGVVGYGGACALVEGRESPADRFVAMEDGRRMGYRQCLVGAGAPTQRVTLIHGAPADAGSWDRLIEQQGGALAGLDVIAVDRLGYGNSAEGTETSLAAHAASLAPLLTPGTVLVGHSYGGPVALRAAADYPELVGAVVLVAGACDAEMNDAVWARKLVDTLSCALPESWATANRELLALTGENDAMRDALDRVVCPVVIVHGTWDPVCPHDGTVDYLRSALINADVQVVSLKHAGHNLHLTHPEVVAREIAALAQDSGTP